MKTYQLLGGLIRYRLFYQLRSIAIGLILDAAILASGLWMQDLFNTLSARQPHFDGHLWWLLLLIISASLLQMGGQFIGFDNTLKTHYPVRGLMMRNVLARLFQLPAASALAVSPGEAMNTLRDDTEVVAYGPGIGLLGQVVMVVIAVVILIRLNALLTLLVLASLVLIVLIAQRWQKKIATYREANRNATGYVTGMISEILSAVQAIQVAQAEKTVMEHFRTINAQRLHTQLRDRLLNDTVDAILGNIAGLGTGLILFLAAIFAYSNHLQVGDITLFIAYIGFITNFLLNIGGTLTNYTRTTISFRRLLTLMQGGKTLVEPHSLSEKHLEVRQQVQAEPLQTLRVTNLTYRYPESGRGIEGISFQIQQGTVTALVGRVGAGKTTLVRSLLGLLPHTEGEIYWNETLIEQPDEFFVPPQAGYTPQVPHLFSSTLQENLSVGRLTDEELLQKAAYLAVFEKDVAGFPDGMQTEIGTNGMKLSGGQVQRTAAARMLLGQAQVLVMDDLSSALDGRTEQLLWERLLHEQKGTQTYLVISHRRAILEQADQILLLEDGRISDQGTLNDLLKRSATMRSLFRQQSSEETIPA
ncbi:ATP-binding cassette domain-containing protein [Tengunoibacter tsumagoiensis]|uniref:HlyB/MsbA family ABC transporter n=1 Tax=Tengunoibacter tsumagoiensis TaxID=2014871 RepID=A0A402A4G4_9CHLR|nr:ABC transporter ATP-binding protein [Tengunoibacter tsumagoiensis]GCE13959.1 HlyB/MsbA family ABC transporter [Tengunoibacter tsumagoiensis]